MKSCRNCTHSRHSGYEVKLYCTRTKQTVAPPMSKSVEAGQRIDAKLWAIAAACADYQREGEVQ